MNIAIIGRGDTLYRAMVHLHENGHTVKLIVTAKEAPEYTKTAEDFREFAEGTGAAFLLTARINREKNIAFIKNCGPMDIGISVNYVNVISQGVIDLFPHGILNAHGGDLPRYRGNACQAWAIINGENKIGLCIHKMVGEALDSGDIIARDYLPIDENTKVGEAYAWIRDRAPVMLLEAAAELEKDREYVLEKQSTNPEDALRCYPRRPEDGKIDWSAPNLEILRLINASGDPFSGAFCDYDGEKLVIRDAERYIDNERYCAVNGQVVQIDKNDAWIIVTTGSGKLKIKEIEFKGERMKPAQVIRSIRKRLK